MRDTMSSSDSSVSTTATMTVLPGEDLTLPRRPWRISPTPWSALVGHEYKGGGTVSDPYVVVFIPDDSENPQNYSQAYKWWITIVGKFERETERPTPVADGPVQPRRGPWQSRWEVRVSVALLRTSRHRSRATTA